MVVADFLRRNHDLTLLFFDHGTETSHDARNFLESYVKDTEIELRIGSIKREKHTRESLEEFWRNERYNFFHSFGDYQIITCHHLDDCAETWIWSSLNGTGKIIPYSNKNVIRPFRLNRKSEFLNWARRKNVDWIEDTSNNDPKYMRNFIRHEIMPKALVVNPGLHTVISKKVYQEAPNRVGAS